MAEPGRVRRALLVSTPGHAESVQQVAASLGARAAGVYAKAAMHVPLEIAEEARRTARGLGADCCVTVGGSSTTGLGKAIALTSDLPILTMPTNYAGSEMTPIYGLTEAGAKKTGRDARVLPKTVIYDPTLTVSLPPRLAAASGMNAIAHCVEALYAHDGNPVTSLMAEEGIRALAGISLGAAGMALHHKLCHVLGGTFDLPHAARYNRDAAPEAMARVARALGTSDAPTGLYDLEAKLGIAPALRDIGMPEEGIERAARIATENSYPNPRAVHYDDVLQLLRAAYEGRRPEP